MVARFGSLLLPAATLLACERGHEAAQGGIAARAPELGETHRVFAVRGGTVYPAPGLAPIQGAVVLVSDGRIAAVGPAGEIQVPDTVPSLDARGGTIVSGFWNSHVHFTEPVWSGADTAASVELEQALTRMLLRFGFLRVFDTGSFPAVTLALRRRIDAGELRGPAILTAGPPFVTVDGTPVYVRPIRLPELRDSASARLAVRELLAQGVDAVKLMTASVMARPPYPVMPVEVVRAAVSEAHKSGKPVLAHPTNRAGLESAVRGGVDVLVHTTPEAGDWAEPEIAMVVDAKVALVPTLQLWRWELARKGRDSVEQDRFQRRALQQLGAFARAGGRVLFGTDVGYVTDYDPSGEYVAMARAGLDFDGILASLTTAPAATFARRVRIGRIEPGYLADLVILARDPHQDPRAFAEVRWAMRGGRVVYVEEGSGRTAR